MGTFHFWVQQRSTYGAAPPGQAGQTLSNLMQVEGLTTGQDEHLAKEKERDLPYHAGKAATVSP